MDEEDQLKFGFDLLDPTKIVPEELVPITKLGKKTAAVIMNAKEMKVNALEKGKESIPGIQNKTEQEKERLKIEQVENAKDKKKEKIW